MNKAEKDFDCVEMKNRIQAKILEEKKQYATEEEYREAVHRQLISDPRWRKFYENANNTARKFSPSMEKNRSFTIDGFSHRLKVAGLAHRSTVF